MHMVDRRQLKSDRFTRARFESWLDQEFEVTAYGSHVTARATLVAVLDAEPSGEFTALFRGSNLPTGLCGVAHRNGERFSVFLEGASGPSLRFAKLRADRRVQGAAIVASGSPMKMP